MHSYDDSEWMRGELRRRAHPTERELLAARQRGSSWQGVELWAWPGATAFGEDDAICDPIAVVEEFKNLGFADLLGDLLRECIETDVVLPRGVDASVLPKRGAKRIPGRFDLLLLAYSLVPLPSLAAFRTLYRSTRLWEVCGFTAMPSYPLLERRFSELEAKWPAFRELMRYFVELAIANDPRISTAVMIDATPFRSPRRLEHRCRDITACLRRGGDRMPTFLAASSDERVQEARKKELEKTEEEAEELWARRGLTRGPIRSLHSRGLGERLYRVMIIDGHEYVTDDLEAGLRRYEGVTSWLGGLKQTAYSLMGGLPLDLLVYPADYQEYDGLGSLIDGVATLKGSQLRLATADSLYATRPGYEFMTRRNLALVAPRQAHGSHPPPGRERLVWRTDEWDEDGVPRCCHCGAEGDQNLPGCGLSFAERSGEPRICFRCTLRLTPECEGEQSIRCANEWRMLTPLSRLTELYHAALYARSNPEKLFHHSRTRHALAGKTLYTRLFSRGVSPQRLLAYTAYSIDWFRFLLRQGWLDPQGTDFKINQETPRKLSGEQDRLTREVSTPGEGTTGLEERLVARRLARTHLPYGIHWERARERLGIPAYNQPEGLDPE